jgi:predicted phosphodiesterase
MNIYYRFCFVLLLAIGINTFSQPIVKFAAIGDYGRWYTPGEALVSQMVHGWNPDFIITLGDNNYEYGADSTIDSNIGQFYHDYIYPYTGNFGQGAQFNKFFPALGNHDFYSDTARTYLNYFALPGNERYYDFIKGNCHFFVVNSDPIEPDGNTGTSAQAMWLKNKLAQSTSRFKIVYFHHPPYSSGQHGNNTDMLWKFKEWGVNVVLCGHEHNYERLVDNTGMTYFVNGLGGKDWRDFATVVPESRFRFTANYGAMLVTSYTDSINFKFIAYPDSIKDDTTFVFPPIGIEPISEVATEFKLEQNYPNPFNPVTKIRFQIPAFVETTRRVVSLIIYDVLGKEISTLVNDELNPGTYEVKWDASAYASGIYFYSLSSASGIITRKMILLK